MIIVIGFRKMMLKVRNKIFADFGGVFLVVYSYPASNNTFWT